MVADLKMSGKYPAKDHAIRTFDTLFKSLPAVDKNKPHAILLAGGVTPYRNDTDRELSFRQESNFFYLTGCNVPESYLLALYEPKSSALGTGYTLTTTLYIVEPTVADLLWSPPPPTLQEARDTYAVDKVEHPPRLVAAISRLPRGTIVHILPQTDQFPTIAVNSVDDLRAVLESTPGKTTEYLLPALHKTRLIKDSYEIAMIRKANDISSRAHEVVMRVLGLAVAGKIKKQSADTPPLPGEWLIEKECEAEAIFTASCRREGSVVSDSSKTNIIMDYSAAHQAYLPIVAASTRASTLHYCCNDREFAWGPVNHRDTVNDGNFSHAHTHNDGSHGRELLPQVLLIDAGCEWDCYSADITRTMPVGNGGKFTQEAKKVYELVLRMQSESFKIAKPGTHWDDVQLLCHRVMIDGFLDMGIFKDSDEPGINGHTSGTKATTKPREALCEEILLTGLSAAFFPHGLGHSLGMDVHDVPSASKPVGSGKYFVDGDDKTNGLPGGHKDFYKYLRLRLELQPGMVVTIEPGVYFHPVILKSYGIHKSCYINNEVLARYEGMGGVRIEDDVLITGTGCENLTKVQSGVEWVESICTGKELV